MNSRKAKKLLTKNRDVASIDPKELFEREKAFLNKPFYLEGNNGQAVLLIHGWTATPYELRRLGTFLNKNGFTVMAPLLPGHGTVPRDLENVLWQDWLRAVDKSYHELKNNYDKIFVIGTSIGSSLAIILNENHPEIAGFVLMATPYKIRAEKIVSVIGKILALFRKYNTKFYPPTFGSASTITRLISYQSYPIQSALETLDLIRASRSRLSKINQPCFLLQSSSDHIACRNSLEKIYDAISSKVKAKKYISRAYHTFISDIKNEHVFEEIFNFLNKN